MCRVFFIWPISRNFGLLFCLPLLGFRYMDPFNREWHVHSGALSYFVRAQVIPYQLANSIPVHTSCINSFYHLLFEVPKTGFFKNRIFFVHPKRTIFYTELPEKNPYSLETLIPVEHHRIPVSNSIVCVLFNVILHHYVHIPTP